MKIPTSVHESSILPEYLQRSMHIPLQRKSYILKELFENIPPSISQGWARGVLPVCVLTLREVNAYNLSAQPHRKPYS
jgi:hypothetical protein